MTHPHDHSRLFDDRPERKEPKVQPSPFFNWENWTLVLFSCVGIGLGILTSQGLYSWMNSSPPTSGPVVIEPDTAPVIPDTRELQKEVVFEHLYDTFSRGCDDVDVSAEAIHQIFEQARGNSVLVPLRQRSFHVRLFATTV